MAGVDTEYDGLARPLPGASIGYLPQEPTLTKPTVQECIDEAVESSQSVLDKYNELSMKLADPDITDDEMSSTMEQLEKLNDVIEAGDLWELERVVSRAMDSLRVPPGDALIENLSGGEKRRTALCRLLLQNHDMLLLDEPVRLSTNTRYCTLLFGDMFLIRFVTLVVFAELESAQHRFVLFKLSH